MSKLIRIGNYRLVGILGQGTYGRVYLGEHIFLGHQVAIKVLRGSLAIPDPSAETFRDDANEKKLEKEMRVISSYQHRNIMPLLDGGFTEHGDLYYVMPVIRETLESCINNRSIKTGTLTLSEIIGYLNQIANALDYIHTPGIDGTKLIHGDVKPSNILFRRHDNTVLISDFGSVSSSITGTFFLKTMGDQVQGTFVYMAPEKFDVPDPDNNKGPRTASDQYSVGVMVYKWISGVLPFSGNIDDGLLQRIQTLKPYSFERMGVHVSQELETAVQRALAKDPDARFANVRAFVAAIEAARIKPYIDERKKREELAVITLQKQKQQTLVLSHRNKLNQETIQVLQHRIKVLEYGLQRAVLHYKTSLRVKPHYISLLLELANSLYLLGKYEEALPIYERVFSLDSNIPRLREIIARIRGLK